MATIEERYQYTTLNDSVLEKDWAAGSKVRTTQIDFICEANGKGKFAEVKFPPALWKIIDETIVNAIDQFVRTNIISPQPARVTVIKVDLTKDGRIRIYNDGPGIEIEIHKVASAACGENVYIPTMIFGMMFQGSNRTPAPGAIIGGTNGIGVKLTSLHSDEFTAETVRDGKYFIQRWKNHMKEPENPHILPAQSAAVTRKEPHTMLSFMPDYKLFGYECFDDAAYDVISSLIRARVIFAAVYTGIPVWFNTEKYSCKTADLARIFYAGHASISTTITPAANPKYPHVIHPMDLCVVVGDSGHAGNVNGIMVRDGRHYTYIKDLIVAGIRAELVKILKDKNATVSPATVLNHIFLFVNAKIPDVHWTGQRKDVVELKPASLRGYTLPQTFCRDLALKLKTIILSERPGKKRKAALSDFDKYRKAKYAGTKRAAECTLIGGEGDSAITQVVIGISKHLGWDFYGTICLGGVIVNCRKECTVTRLPNGNKYIGNESAKIRENKFLNAFYAVTGLNPKYDYDPSKPSYAAQIAELKYGHFLGCVDQDLDGMGQIMGLILNDFHVFWPHLLAAGYVQWYCSPLIRAWPRLQGKIMEFYSENEFRKWANTVEVANYQVRYYKGLSTHSRDEVVHMFAYFRNHVYTYYIDDRSNELFEIYFGRNPNLRKTELSKVPSDLPPEVTLLQEQTLKISCSDHLLSATNAYQRDNIDRKLNNVIDGQNQAGRKVLDQCIKAMSSGKARKVSQLAGYIAEHGNYHHGEAGLGTTIAGKAFITCGGKQIPLLLPQSQFGSRLGGGDDKGADRYIWATLNKQICSLLLPAADYGLYDFTFNEGERCEPAYFIPILPLAILESTELPGTAWKLKTWARDVFCVIETVRLMIRVGAEIPIAPLPAATYRGSPYEWKGTFRSIGGKQFTVGKYEYNSQTNSVIITELPLRVWTNSYIESINKRRMKDGGAIINWPPNDKSDDISVLIEFKLQPGAIEALDEIGTAYIDGIEEYFRLCVNMDTCINLTLHNTVVSYTNYEDPLRVWFGYRRDHYKKRLDRMRICLEMSIVRLENMIRYISADYEFRRKPKAEMVRVLAADNFARLRSALIDNPKFVANDELVAAITTGEKATYDYLLNLTDIGKSSENLAALRGELDKKQIALESHNMTASKGLFPGSVIWLAELDALEDRLRKGFSTFWKFDDKNHF